MKFFLFEPKVHFNRWIFLDSIVFMGKVFKFIPVAWQIHQQTRNANVSIVGSTPKEYFFHSWLHAYTAWHGMAWAEYHQINSNETNNNNNDNLSHWLNTSNECTQ